MQTVITTKSSMKCTHKFCFTAIISLLFISIFTALAVPVGASDITVGPAGTYKTIQAAVNAASPGDSIIVAPGTYVESITINKPLILTSIEGAATTTIQAAAADTLLLTGTDIEINGFTLTGAQAGSAVLIDHASGCSVTNNVVRGQIRGVYLQSATGNEISNNNLTNNGYGVYFDYSSDNTVANNICTFEQGTPNGSALGDGIFMDNSGFNTITNNILSNNHKFGLSLWESSNNKIIGNTISANEQFGIRLRNSNNNTLVFNVIQANVERGIYIAVATGNMIYLNSFIQEPGDLSDVPSTILNSTQKLRYTYNATAYTGYMGNYYSGYVISDVNGDGIGDNATPLGDRYPLVKPVDQYVHITVAPTSSPSASSTPSAAATGSNSSQNSSQSNSTASTLPGFDALFALFGILIALFIATKRVRR